MRTAAVIIWATVFILAWLDLIPPGLHVERLPPATCRDVIALCMPSIESTYHDFGPEIQLTWQGLTWADHNHGFSVYSQAIIGGKLVTTYEVFVIDKDGHYARFGQPKSYWGDKEF